MSDHLEDKTKKGQTSMQCVSSEDDRSLINPQKQSLIRQQSKMSRRFFSAEKEFAVLSRKSVLRQENERLVK